jgi:hypothetical protein
MDDKLIEPIQEFLREHKFTVPNWFVYVMLSVLIALLTYLLKMGKDFVLKYYAYYKNSRDLHPFYTRKTIFDARRYFVPTKVQNKAPSNNDELMQSRGKDITNDAIDWFITKAFVDGVENRFYIILSDSGMGKTTFLINLYLRYTTKIFRKYDMKLFPIGSSKSFDEIKKMAEKGQDKNTILLLDAFDEDNKVLDDWKTRFDEIISATHTFRGVIITSRTQFFPSEDEEPILTKIKTNGSQEAFHSIHKLYVTPFSQEDIKLFLSKKFKWYNLLKRNLKEKAVEIVNKCPNLMVRPMLLSYIDDLLDSNVDYKYTFQIYDALINRWIAREADRVEENKREKFRENLSKFSYVTAREIYKQWKGLKRNGLYLENEDITKISMQYGIALTDLEMKGKSLLNRNNIGQYKFAHKSILEYLLAYLYVTSESFQKEFEFASFDQAEKFSEELSKVQVVLTFFSRNHIIQQTKWQEYKVNGTDLILKRYMKSLSLNETQLENLLLEMDDVAFLKGFNAYNIEDITILKDSSRYKMENFSKLFTLKRITLFTTVLRIKGGKLDELPHVLPNCYIPGFKDFGPVRVYSKNS